MYLTKTDSHIASIFTREASLEASPTFSDIEPIQLILFRAQLPPEVLALAFNILAGLNRQSVPADSDSSAPSDLLVVSTLSLAVSYILDHPPSLSYWSRDVCDCRWTAQRIDEMGLRLLAQLDWRLHEFSSPREIQVAMNQLLEAAWDVSSKADMLSELDDALPTDSGPLKLETAAQCETTMEERPAQWVNGQITPNATPIESDFDCVWSFSDPVL